VTDLLEQAALLLAELVAIPSVNPAFRADGLPAAWFGEAALAARVAEWLGGAGLEVTLDEVLAGRPNVVARLPGRAARRTLLWEAHLDTVQGTGMTIEPFRPVTRDGRLYGRGAVDDKGCLVAFMLALGELARAPAAVDLTFVAAVDEEHQFRGILHHLGHGTRADGGVAGEPTGLRVVRACKGCVRWVTEVTGRAAHSSRPEEGIDAIAMAADLLVHLRRVLAPRLAARTHALLGPASLICSRVQGGEGVNTVPARCRLVFDRRTLPDETGAEAWQEIAAEVRGFAAGLPAGAAVVMHPPFVDSIAMEVPPEAAIVAAGRAACRDAGIDEAPLGVAFGSDASKMTRAGIPTIIFGPGDIAQAHTADEFVEVEQVARAARMLVDLARRFGAAGTDQ
jgi:acetylornithine deacetylase